MRYTTTIEIDKPMDEVIKLFDNTDNYVQWMDGLQSFKVLEGKAGQEGSKAHYKFKIGKRKIEMVETVTKRNFPYEYTVSYNTKGVINTVKNIFKKIDNGRTKYSTENHFHFKGIMKLIGYLMPAMFKKQSLKYQSDFKNFVENN